jgi:hypothetical protein
MAVKSTVIARTLGTNKTLNLRATAVAVIYRVSWMAVISVNFLLNFLSIFTSVIKFPSGFVNSAINILILVPDFI